MSEDIDLSEIDKKYKDKCSLIKAGKCKNVNIFLQQSRENARLKEENVKLLFDKGTLVEFCNKLTQIIDKKKESENKLLQTLQEIKEIIENNCWDYTDVTVLAVKDKILQKITKAEEE